MHAAASGWEFASQIASTLGGIATVATAVVALLALRFARAQVKHQSGARDFEAFIELQREINSAWEKYVTCDSDEHREFYFGQLMVVYESACYMFNHDVAGPKVQGLLKDHIVEVLVDLIRDEASLMMIRKIASGENTYAEIVKFFRRHRGDYMRHWTFLVESGLATVSQEGEKGGDLSSPLLD